MIRNRTLWPPRNTALLLAWLILGSFYLIRFNLSAAVPLLRHELGLSHSQAGLLMSSFFVPYLIMQLPGGFLGDTLGPRRVLFVAALVSVAGNFFFSMGSLFFWLAVAQVINGLGQGPGMTSGVKLIVNWFPKTSRATALGFFFTALPLGSASAGLVSGYLGSHLGWRAAFIYPPLLVLTVGVVLFAVARDQPADAGLASFDDEKALEQEIMAGGHSAVRIVLADRNIWIVSLSYSCMCYVQVGFLMWLPSFLKEAYAMSVERAGFFSGMVILSGVVASPLGGFLSDRFFGGKKRHPIIIEMLLLAAFSAVSWFQLPFSFLLVPLVFMGLLIWLPDVLFTSLPADLFSRKMAGTATGFMVSFGCLAAIIGMYASGLLIDLFRSYGPLFLSFAFLAFLGAIGVCFVRERSHAAR